MYQFVTSYTRMQPPTAGHEKLVAEMKRLVRATEGDGRLYLSPTHDDNKNPLDFWSKHAYVKRAFEDIDLTISEQPCKNMFDMLDWVAQLGYHHVHVVVGDDRLRDGLANRITTHLKGVHKIPFVTVHSSGSRDPDGDDVTGMSATKMRGWAKLNDYASFENGLPNKLKPLSVEILSKVREACQFQNSATF